MFGRTSLGAQEILRKSGRLTQTERLVLIVLGDQVRFEALHAKLSSLSGDRIESALLRLVELHLAYEEFLAPSEPVGALTLPPGAVRDFLEQKESDPVTVMADSGQLDGGARARALEVEVGKVLGSSGTDAGHVAVPLGKLFPQHPAVPGATGSMGRAERRLETPDTQARLGALEESLNAARVPSMQVPSRGRTLVEDPDVDDDDEPLVIETAKNSSAGGVMMLIGGLAAALVVAAILLYAWR